MDTRAPAGASGRTAARAGCGIRNDRVPFYKKMFDDAGAQPGDIRTAKDLEKLPFTSKTDLRDNYPYGLFAVPMDEVVRIHASSGTTGKATVVGYTASDLALWDECVARALTCAGGTREDDRAGLLRLRPVHRRTGPARRGRAHRRDGHPRVDRQHRAADYDAAGLRVDDALLHAVVCALHRRDAGKATISRFRPSTSRPACSAPSRGRWG